MTMRFSKKIPDEKLISQTQDSITAFRGSGKGGYTSDMLVLDRRIEREEEHGAEISKKMEWYPSEIHNYI